MFNIPHVLVVQSPQNSNGGSSVNPAQQLRLQPAGAAGGSQQQQQQQQQQQLQQLLASGLLQNAASGSNTSSSSSNNPSVGLATSGNSLLQQLQLLVANLPRGIQTAPTSAQTPASSLNGPSTRNPIFEARSSSRTDVTEDKDKLFPYILHGLLEDVEKADHSSIISWSPDGKTFRIYSSALFTSKILRLYFQYKGFDEFRAQLDDWGFCHEQEGFFHPCFVRGQPMLCRHMRCSRKAVKEVNNPKPANAMQPQSPVAQSSSSQLPPQTQFTLERYYQQINNPKPANAMQPQAPVAQSSGSQLPPQTQISLEQLQALINSNQHLQTFASSNQLQQETSSRLQHALASLQAPTGPSTNTQIVPPVTNLQLQDNSKQQRLPSPRLESSKSGGGNFLKRLRKVLLDADDDCKTSIISWSSSGRSFKVHDRDAFVQQFLPAIIMDSSKYGAFQKILRRWGFSHITTGAEEGGYLHPFFLRYQPKLCEKLTQPRMQELAWSKGHQELPPPVSKPRTNPKLARESALSYFIPQMKHQTKASPKRPRNADDSTPSASPNKVAKHSVSTSLDPPSPGGAILNPEKESDQAVFLMNHVHQTGFVPGLLFPWGLHDMLDDAEQMDETRKIISWQPDGVSFTIRDRDLFVSKILPQYFSVATWDEFIHILSNWGFVRFTSGPQKGAFIHRLLVRGKRALCKQMRIHGKTVSDLMKHQSHFLVRLHAMLCNADKDGKQAIVSWSSTGKKFTVHDQNAFINTVFPTYFDSITITSFEQKLRRWGFVRSPPHENGDEASFSHPSFERDPAPQIKWTDGGSNMGEFIKPEHAFLLRLRTMLDDAEKHGHQLVVSWLPHGKAFFVHDRPYFTSNIMPSYFKSKFTSFRQSLRNHGFAQMGGSGWDEGAYYHKLFIRDDPSLCQYHSIQQMKQAMPDWIPASEEPDFHALTEDDAVAAMVSLKSTCVSSEAAPEGTEEREETRRHHEPAIATPMTPFMKAIAATKPVTK